MFSIKSIFKKKTEAKPDDSIEFFKKKFKKEQQKRLSAKERKQRLKQYVEKAGFEISTKKLNKIFFNAAIVINLLVSAFLIYYFSISILEVQFFLLKLKKIGLGVFPLPGYLFIKGWRV